MSTDFITLRKLTLCVRKQNEERLLRDIKSIGLTRNIIKQQSSSKAFAVELDLSKFDSSLDTELLAYNAVEDIKTLKYCVIC